MKRIQSVSVGILFYVSLNSSNGKTVLGIFTAEDVSTLISMIVDQSIEDQLKD